MTLLLLLLLILLVLLLLAVWLNRGMLVREGADGVVLRLP